MKSRNRKLRFAYFAATLITLGFVAVGSLPSLVPVYGLFVAGVLGAAGVLTAGNVSQKIFNKEVYLKELEMKGSE